MNNEKILNLSDVDTEDFEAIKAAIEDWKACGLSGKFGFLSEKETQECMDALKKHFRMHTIEEQSKVVSQL